MATVERVSRKKIRCRKKMTRGERLFAGFAWAFLILCSIVAVYPVLHMIALSFSGDYDFVKSGGLYLIPAEPTIDNYTQVIFRWKNFRSGFLTTIERTVLGTAMALAANALLSYVLSRKKFLFKSQLSLFWLFTMYASAGMIPTIILYKKLGLLQTFWVYVIPGMVSAFHVMVMKTYMEQIPDSLEESAQIEGAGHLKIFWSVVSPICKPVYAAIALFIAVQQWNSWFDALLYNRYNDKLTTLQYEIAKWVASSYATQTGTVEAVHANSPRLVVSAACVLTILPVIIIYPFFQKCFVTGLRIRGVKE